MKIIEIPNIFNEKKIEKKERLKRTIGILFKTAEKQMQLVGLDDETCGNCSGNKNCSQATMKPDTSG